MHQGCRDMSSGVKERIDRWMNASAGDDLRRMWQWLKDRKWKLLVVLGWGAAFAAITIKSYWLVYLQNPVLIKHQMVITRVRDWVPSLITMDYLVMIVVSTLAGALLIDLGDVLYGWLTSISLSFILSVTWAFLYVWYSLGVGMFFSNLGVADVMLPWVAEYVILNVFRMWFPFVPLMSLITGFCGAVLRSMIW